MDIVQNKYMPTGCRVYQSMKTKRMCKTVLTIGHRNIMVMNFIMKLWEMLIDCHQRCISFFENQFGFMPKHTHVMHLQHYKVTIKYLHMILIYTEKTYNRVPKEVFWWVVAKKVCHVSISVWFKLCVRKYKLVLGHVEEWPKIFSSRCST